MMLSDYAIKDGWIEWEQKAAPVGVVVECCYLDNRGGYYENIVFNGAAILSDTYGGEKTRPPDLWRCIKK